MENGWAFAAINDFAPMTHTMEGAVQTLTRGLGALAGWAPQAGKRRYSVRTYFAIVIAIALLPALAGAGWLAVLWARSEQARIQQDAEQRAQEINAVLDRDIRGKIGLLTVLAGSHSLQTGNLEEFYKEALQIARTLNVRIVVRDLIRDEQVINTFFPFGRNLRSGMSELQRKAREQALQFGAPIISDVFYGPASDMFLIAVTVPVTRDGKIPYSLSIGIPVDEFGGLLIRSANGDNGAQIATIIDRNGVVIARSQHAKNFVGKPVNAHYLLGRSESRGSVSATNFEGTRFRWFFIRSELTGWRTAIGVPENVLAAPKVYAAMTVVLLGAVLFLLSAALAHRIGLRISAAINALRYATEDFRHGREIVPVTGQFKETSELANSLTSASTEMRKIESRSRIALEVAKYGTWSWNLETDAFSASEVTCEMFRISSSSVTLSQDFLQRIHPADRDEAQNAMLNCVSDAPVEFRIVLDDGAVRWISLRSWSVLDDFGKYTRVDGIVYDFTKRKLADEERAHLVDRLRTIREQERVRLARELHDEMGQSFAAMMLEIKRLEQHVDAAGHDQLRVLSKQLESMGESIRRIAWELRPMSIAELGLAGAIESYVLEWSARFGIAVDIHCDPIEIDLRSRIQTVIYRIVQEALTNVVKHAAGATTVSVVLRRGKDDLSLTIEDNGCGFDMRHPTSIGTTGGLGLVGMLERVTLVGGRFEVESSIGSGTMVFVRLPLQRTSRRHMPRRQVVPA